MAGTPRAPKLYRYNAINVAAAAQHPADGGFAEIGGREADDEIGMQHNAGPVHPATWWADQGQGSCVSGKQKIDNGGLNNK